MNSYFPASYFSQVYSGKRGACQCGCSGKHYEVNDKSFDLMLKKVLDNRNAEAFAGGVFLNVGARTYTAYVAPGLVNKFREHFLPESNTEVTEYD